MAEPARIDRDIYPGDDTPPLVWGFGPADAPEIPTGAAFRLDITWSLPGWAVPPGISPTGTITASSPTDGLTVDYGAGTVAWAYTTAQSATIPPGAAASYALRCLVDGKTQTWAFGFIVGRLGGRP